LDALERCPESTLRPKESSGLVRHLAFDLPSVYSKQLNMSLTAPTDSPSFSKHQELRKLAQAVAENSYSPYSRFRVGAAILLTDGSIVTGCNVENASYRLTSCAEQAAIARAVSERGPDIRLSAVAVANLNGTASMPCGACRQTLSEFGDDDVLILYPGEGGADESTTLGALLPHAFRIQFLDPK
jgi:cytidine deaminase